MDRHSKDMVLYVRIVHGKGAGKAERIVAGMVLEEGDC